jgi:hypothetical protein
MDDIRELCQRCDRLTLILSRLEEDISRIRYEVHDLVMQQVVDDGAASLFGELFESCEKQLNSFWDTIEEMDDILLGMEHDARTRNRSSGT